MLRYFCLLRVRKSFWKCLHKKGVKSRLILIEKGNGRYFFWILLNTFFFKQSIITYRVKSSKESKQCDLSIWFSDVGSYLKFGGQVVMWGYNLPPLASGWDRVNWSAKTLVCPPCPPISYVPDWWTKLSCQNLHRNLALCGLCTKEDL